MGFFGYYLVRTITLALHVFPLWAQYLFSDVLFFFSFYVFRCHRDIVDTNLSNAYPAKTKKERGLIAKGFYSHRYDTIIENFYYDRICVANAKKFLKIKNPELVNSYLDQGRPVVVFIGQYCNLEWLSVWPLYSKHRSYPVYKKKKNRVIDKFYSRIRGKFGSIPVERSAMFRQLIHDHLNKIPFTASISFDQVPRVYEDKYRQAFLNQETAWLTDTEKLAQRLDAVVFFLNSQKVKRGYYDAEFILVTEHAGACQNFEVTATCIKKLEQQINDRPEYWLWSSKRGGRSRGGEKKAQDQVVSH